MTHHVVEGVDLVEEVYEVDVHPLVLICSLWQLHRLLHSTLTDLRVIGEGEVEAADSEMYYGSNEERREFERLGRRLSHKVLRNLDGDAFLHDVVLAADAVMEFAEAFAAGHPEPLSVIATRRSKISELLGARNARLRTRSNS